MARIINLLIELARTPFQRVWVQFMCILTPFAREGVKAIWLGNFFAADHGSRTPASCVASKFAIHYTIASRTVKGRIEKGPRPRGSRRYYGNLHSYGTLPVPSWHLKEVSSMVARMCFNFNLGFGGLRAFSPFWKPGLHRLCNDYGNCNIQTNWSQPNKGESFYFELEAIIGFLCFLG